ncbi:hypothetical protein [Bradyrhizobium sp.]|uniref:hypothetical protein n=1 Tax=Bradyrhizobium sp. TaxID=376 RepID=UPI003C3E0EC2
MDILFVLAGLVAGLMVVAWSCARSYFERGRRHGVEEAMREMARGVSSHCALEGGTVPASVEKAMAAVKALGTRGRFARGRSSTDPYHAQLWVLGDAIGEACWLKGHAAGVRRKAPAEGKIRVDLSVNELLQLGWLAHLGFQHMMPNYRGFESYRFGGEREALEGARAISKIEAAVPVQERPVADLAAPFKGRQKLICDWWQVTPDRLMA